MQHAAMLEALRQVVLVAFQRLGARGDASLGEHLLIRNDTYCGRRFQLQGFSAAWFIEEDQLKIYGQDGSVAQVLKASQAVAAVIPAHSRAA